LLHQALRTILGEHVEQKGSAVHSKNLRFDFSHFAKLTQKELTQVEQFVNARINDKMGLEENRNVPIDVAQKQGAMMLFGEKYGDTVRTIKYGKSMELCGGTHVRNTGDIWYFKIISESAIASGIRRIEAITNDAVKDYFLVQDEELSKLKSSLKNPADILKSVHGLQEENTKLKKEVEQLLLDKAASLKEELLQHIEVINGINFLASEINLDANTIKNLAFELGNKVDNLFFINGATIDEKALLTIYIAKNLVKEKDLNAGTMVRELGKLIQGGGGGQPFFATAGGKNPSGIKQTLAKAKELIQ
jgi:alanyl-tRNA synthetase